MEDVEDEEVIKQEIATIENDLLHLDQAIQRLESKRLVLESRKEELKLKQQCLATTKLCNTSFEKTDHPWSGNAVKILKSSFKMIKFRPYQMSAINAIMLKHDCILIMPTGGGKSLCYQLPALLCNGVVLVVSPLISLVEDQIMRLDSLNIQASKINASSKKEHINRIHAEMTLKGSALRLLYVTPEKLAKSKRFMSKLEKMYEIGNFSLLAIDEVHCCSQWGNDFRPDYKFLGVMKRQFPNVPIIGLTATATSKVIADVKKILAIPNCLVLKSSFNRPNLKYEVHPKPYTQKESIDLLEDLVKGKFSGQSGIIYCFTIKESEEIASELLRKGIKARSYHAQLDPMVRSAVHRAWVNNEVQVVVATVAFGMGIDKPNVRFVIHHSIAKSMENFYQESGRAGRDDQLAHCILLYRFADMFRQSTMVFTEQTGLENLYRMVAYCLNRSKCRRSIIASHFGEEWNASDCQAMCDNCEKAGFYLNEERDLTKQCLSIYDILEFCKDKKERLTAHKLLESWTGKGPAKLRPSSLNTTTFSQEKCEHIIASFLLEGYLKEEFHFTPYANISYIFLGPKAGAVKRGMKVMLPLFTKRAFHFLPDHQTTATNNNSSPTLPGESPVAAKKQRLSNLKMKPCAVNDTNTLFSSVQFPTTSSTLTQLAFHHKTSQKEKIPRAKKIIEKVTSPKEEIQLSDDELDFGESDYFNSKSARHKKRVSTMVILSDSD